MDADNCSFWRRRFLACFEKPIKLTNNVAFKHAYQKRKYVLKHGAQFQTGETRKEKGCLELVRDLVVGEFDLEFGFVSVEGNEAATLSFCSGEITVLTK